MPRMLALSALALMIAAGAAEAQTVGPEAGPQPPAAAARFEAGFEYGFAVFTESHTGAAWFPGLPTGGEMDLQTSASLGVRGSWLASDALKLGLRITGQRTRLLAERDGAATRTDLTLVHAIVEAERSFGRGGVTPLFGLGAGAVLALDEDADASTWHYAASASAGLKAKVSERVGLRLLARVPVIWAAGELVAQVEAAGGAAIQF